jgi:hypothetical protein
MINTQKRSALAVLFFVIGMVTLAVAPALAESSQNEQTGLAMAKAGPLEISPSRVKLVLGKRDWTCFHPVIRLKIKNASASDARVILFKKSFQIIDDLDYTWLNPATPLISGGVALSDQEPNKFAESFTQEKDKFVTVPPQQIVEAQILTDPNQSMGLQCVEDKGSEVLQTHRPKTVALSASLGIIGLDNTAQIVPFSFSDLSVTEITVR